MSWKEILKEEWKYTNSNVTHSGFDGAKKLGDMNYKEILEVAKKDAKWFYSNNQLFPMSKELDDPEEQSNFTKILDIYTPFLSSDEEDKRFEKELREFFKIEFKKGFEDEYWKEE